MLKPTQHEWYEKLSEKDNLKGLLNAEYTIQKKVHIKGTIRTYFEKIKSKYD